ncbi:MAG: regulator of replication initiation timing [Alteromonas naphthalenivorans]|jgi:regulator of replication initiation timing
MEMLSALEQKVENLITLIRHLKEENLSLGSKNHELRDQVRQLEGSLLKEAKQVEKELTQERETTKQAVDNLIKSIDELIESGG